MRCSIRLITESSWNQWFLWKKIPRDDAFVDLITNSLIRMEDVVWNSMKASEGYKVILNFHEVGSENCERILFLLFPNIL